MAVGLEKLSVMHPSPRIGSATLFLAGGRTYTVDDAVASALFRGALEAAIEETLSLAAAEERAEAAGLEIDDRALQESSERFRYDHDLITAGETEEWLEGRGMTTEDFVRWLHQRLCREAAGPSETRSAPDDFPDLLRIHLWLSGEMEDLSKQLSRRVAADLEIANRGESLSGETAEMMRIEASFDRLVSQVTTGDTRSRKLASMQMPLAKIEIETLELDSEAAAREAFLCVRDDGAKLSEVALQAGYRAERAEIFIDTLDEKLAQRLLGTAEGGAIGPVLSDGRFKVHQVLRKIKPSLSDPAVLRRIDEVIIDEFFDDLCARHIRTPDVARTGK